MWTGRDGGYGVPIIPGGVLLKEGFVTVKEMEHNMSVREHRMEN
jgi:hypothetical protein